MQVLHSRFFDGLNQLELGYPDEAEKILARIDGLRPKIQISERVRIELLNYQMKVFLALKERDQAITYLEEAAKASFSPGSERHLQEAFALLRHLSVETEHFPASFLQRKWVSSDASNTRMVRGPDRLQSRCPHSSRLLHHGSTQAQPRYRSRLLATPSTIWLTLRN